MQNCTDDKASSMTTIVSSRRILLGRVLFLWILVLLQTPRGFAKKAWPTYGQRCDRQCRGEHVVCNRTSQLCSCHEDYPITVRTQNKDTLCVKAAKLGEDCLKDEMCLSEDANSDCIQHGVKAMCACQPDFHIIWDKSARKNKCVKEGQLINSDLATLLLVGAAMTLFCGLTCLVLRIFARARFGPRLNRYANAQLPPPITLSTDQGEVSRGHSQSRNSSQRSSLVENTRRQSGSLLAPPSRQGEGGSRRASNSSIRSTGSNRSHRSYSLRNPGHSNHIHQTLQQRPSDPESRSQTSQQSTTTQDNNMNGSNASPAAPIQKGKRSGSAGVLPV